MTARSYSLALRLVSAIRLGAVLVMRPRRAVAHVYLGPVSESGLLVPVGFRVLCGARTRRLSVVVEGLAAVGSERVRLCRRCAPLVRALRPGSPYAGRRLVSLDDQAAAFNHLQPEDFTHAAGLCETVDETRQVGRISQLVLGSPPMVARTEEQRARRAPEDAILARRKVLIAAERTEEERAANRLARAVCSDEMTGVAEARQIEDRLDRFEDRYKHGTETAYEREVLVAAGRAVPR